MAETRHPACGGICGTRGALRLEPDRHSRTRPKNVCDGILVGERDSVSENSSPVDALFVGERS
jgi:hypothetical protein